MAFDPNVAKALIEGAVADFLESAKNVEHLQRGRVERTCASDLATALKPLFEIDRISVDSPYNKHHGAAKYLGKDLIELDIAIHERGNDQNNLVAIELETNNYPKRDDVWKLKGLTESLGAYGYKLGLFLVLGIEKRAGEVLTIEWYSDGTKLD